MKLTDVSVLLLSFGLCASVALRVHRAAQTASLSTEPVSGGIDEDLPPESDPPEALVVLAGKVSDGKLAPLLRDAALLVADTQGGPRLRVDGLWQPLSATPTIFEVAVGAHQEAVALFQVDLPDTPTQQAERTAALSAHPDALSIAYLRWPPRTDAEAAVAALHAQGIDLIVGDGDSVLVQATEGRWAVHGLGALGTGGDHSQIVRVALRDTPDGVSRALELFPVQPETGAPLELAAFSEAYWTLLSKNHDLDRHLKSRLRLHAEQPGRHYVLDLSEAP